jgi:GNAT superfamily N-acetyltransferase
VTIAVSPSIVRIATPNDYQEIWRLFLQSHRENGLFELAPEKVEWFLTRVLRPDLIPAGDMGARGLIGVVGPQGALEAICFILISTTWYSNEKHLGDLLLYVDPEFRHSNHSKALVEWMKQQSQLVGMKLMGGVVSTERTEGKCRLYRRMMPKVGEFHLFDPRSLTIGSSLAAVA